MNENNIKALFPEGVETITISKNDYDRLCGQLTYKNIVLQSKIDKAIEVLNKRYEEDKEIFKSNYDFKFILDFEEELLDVLKEDK